MSRRAYRAYASVVLTVCAAAMVIMAIGIIALLGRSAEQPPVVIINEQPTDECWIEEDGTEEVPAYDPATVNALAQLLWGEARGCSTTEQAAVIWCVLNRADSELPYFPDAVLDVIRQRNAFAGYRESNPIEPEQVEIVLDVLARWDDERAGADDVGRVLPAEYLYFTGDGRHNYFRQDYTGGAAWDFSSPSPYEMEVH